MIIEKNQIVREKYNDLIEGDVISTTLNLKKTEELIFIDLIERNIKLFPSALSQCLTRSKCLQSVALKKWMIPNTLIIRDKNDMPDLLNDYSAKSITRIVTKLDRKDCGMGINIWNSCEELNNNIIFGNPVFPFVAQPFVPDAVDIRVIIIGNYIESYWRKNTGNFRHNLAMGGKSGEFQLDKYQIRMCDEIMERGKFPYAHIDLLVSENKTYLSEISLRGGIKGAKIKPDEYLEKIKNIEDQFKKSLNY